MGRTLTPSEVAERSAPLVASSALPTQAQLSPEQRRKAIELVTEWLAQADESEPAETWEFLRAALDEDRLSDRRLFS